MSGEKPTDIRSFSQELGSFRDGLNKIEEHFLFRNFLVGYSLTLADVYLVHALANPFRHLFEKKTRLNKVPNLSRYMTLNLKSFFFQYGYGQVKLCVKQA